MAKKEVSPPSRKLPLFIGAIVLIFIGLWVSENRHLTNWKDEVVQYVENRDITTLRARYLPKEIMEMGRKEVQGNNKRILQDVALKYYPYLLLNVKYTDGAKPREGVLLWGLNDGEMILNTETWETTHGFHDCLECTAAPSDFKIIQALADRQSPMTIDELQKQLQVERDLLTHWIDEAKKKHLIIQKGNTLQLHFENPKLLVTPQTKINQHLVSKPLGDAQKVPKTYTRSQIIAITKAAFGKDFTIRSEQEIFLPVYNLQILNPDGSIELHEWNGLTGKRIIPYYLK